MQGVKLGHLLVGKPLETKDLPHQAISKPIGLAVFASDALSSTAYATQEMLIILALAGGSAALFGISIPLAIAISVLLIIVTLSYRQTIHAYPNGGGAYIVARDNLGELPAQIAGAALLTDYILTVAVSISSGVEQITSAFQDLHPYRVEIAVGVIILMTVVNLRGVKESGSIFAVPTYFFLAITFVTLGVGFFRLLTGTLSPVEGVEALHHNVAEPLTLFLILRAFSSGCTALTGIEAISNGITAFKEPKSRNAAITLAWMSTILIVLFLGITFLANQIQAQPSHVETVISQMGRAIYGNGSIFYFLLLAGTALILLMAANTSYADFPRLAALHAGDGFLPRQLTYRGGRLVFSWGILVLAGAASVLVILAGATTTQLIPLYAVGVFLSFTISQTGMVVRLRKVGRLKPGEVVKGLETDLTYDPHWRTHLAISAIGAVCTGIVMIIFAVTKFTSGAWFIVVLIPALVYVFFRIHYHYKDVAHTLSLQGARPNLERRDVRTLILVDDVHKETARMVDFANSLGHPWQAVHVGVSPEKAEVVKQKWEQRIGTGELVVLPSPFRQLAEPIKDYIEQLQREVPGCFVHVIMGHLVMDTFWGQALHQNSAFIFNLALGRLERVVVTHVPYQIHAPQTAEEDTVTAAQGA
ncbi:MAG: APC family permease [Anaerolineae bacterium]|nr:APC family permease [Anaerolineae bacterium]NUQ04931.1 APC family permease [Anaerolineae bacterium]